MLEPDRFPSPSLLDFLRNLFFFKKKILNMVEVRAVDAAALNLSTELNFTDCSMGFGEISFLK